MTLEILQQVLGWTAVINLGLMMFSWIVIMLAGEWAYSVHNRMLPIERPVWNQMMFNTFAYFKISTFVFFVGPYLALCIVGG
jgi:hypothetical protein